MRNAQKLRKCRETLRFLFDFGRKPICEDGSRVIEKSAAFRSKVIGARRWRRAVHGKYCEIGVGNYYAASRTTETLRAKNTASVAGLGRCRISGRFAACARARRKVLRLSGKNLSGASETLFNKAIGILAYGLPLAAPSNVRYSTNNFATRFTNDEWRLCVMRFGPRRQTLVLRADDPRPRA
jgi:hypothetical protein